MGKKVKMAALDDSLTNFEGRNWSLLVERLGLSTLSSDSEDDENTKVRRESTTTRLKREEMPIFGYAPRWEDFYLVVCDVCGQAVKPQALKQHIGMAVKRVLLSADLYNINIALNFF